MSDHTHEEVPFLEGATGAPPAVGLDGLPAQDENGVDLTLIREMLARSPLERLLQAEAFMRALASVRAVGRKPPP